MGNVLHVIAYFHCFGLDTRILTTCSHNPVFILHACCTNNAHSVDAFLARPVQHQPGDRIEEALHDKIMTPRHMRQVAFTEGPVMHILVHEQK